MTSPRLLAASKSTRTEAEVRAALAARHDDVEKCALDLMRFGVCYAKDGRHVPASDVFLPAVKESDQ